MNKSFALFGLGAAVLVGLPSCQSSHGGYGDYEEATPMSEFVSPDGNLPDWVLEGSDSDQIAAGSTTEDRNKYPIPDGESSVSTRQNHPAVASDDDVIVDEAPQDVLPPIADTTPTFTEPTTPVVTPKPKPSTPKNPGTSKTGKNGKSGKATKKPDKPTMVVFTVKKGDNLSLIASRCNTTVDAIRKASGIKGDKIYAGQTIKVPYTPASYKAAQKSGKGGATTAAPAKGGSYTVKKGDTISVIASRNGVTQAELLKANGISAQQASKIRPGQKLTIPGKATANTKKSAAPTKKAAPAKKKTTKKR